MPSLVLSTFTSFDGWKRIAQGDLASNVLAVKRAIASGPAGPVLTFDDRTGSVWEVDTRGTEAEVLARLPQALGRHDVPEAQATDADSPPAAPRGRGRPKLGVVAREVTLLPRHWDWLSAQPGGASVALRKLVEEAKRSTATRDDQRKTQERAYRFMSVIAGNLAHFEDSTRALFAADMNQFTQLTAEWPVDVRDYARRLANDDTPEPSPHAMTDKRSLKQNYLETTIRAGVYAIKNTVTGRTLVAGNMNVEGVLNRHRFELRHGTHRNVLLSQDWAAHGESSFTFEVLDRVKPREDSTFDVARELDDLVALWRQEIPCQGDRGYDVSRSAS